MSCNFEARGTRKKQPGPGKETKLASLVTRDSEIYTAVLMKLNGMTREGKSHLGGGAGPPTGHRPCGRKGRLPLLMTTIRLHDAEPFLGSDNLLSDGS